MKIWIDSRAMNADGEVFPAPIACVVDASESVLHDIGKGLRAYVVVAPPPLPPTTAVVEATTGVVLPGDLTATRQSVAKSGSFSIEAFESFQEAHRVRRDEAFVCTDKEFWSFISKLGELTPE